LRRPVYNGLMRNEARDVAPVGDAATRLEAAGLAAAHVAEMARAFVAMGRYATSISSSAYVDPSEAAAIRDFLPELAARYGIAAQVEQSGSCLTVTFERGSK
jgi:hypothetical protein